MARRQYKGAAGAKVLSGTLASGATTVTLTADPGAPWPDGSTGNFIISIDRGLSTEEKILCSSRTGATITVASSGRGYDGLGGSGISHSNGATVEHVLGAIDLDEPNDHINTTSRDDHAQYLNTTRHDVAAVRHAVLPWGTLGYAQVTADQGPITTEVDLTSLTVTVTVGSGRRIRVSCEATVSGANAFDEHDLYIKEGATYLQQHFLSSGASGTYLSHYAAVVLTPSAGSHTYKLALQRTQGSGSVTLRASAGNPAFILVEDIGL